MHRFIASAVAIVVVFALGLPARAAQVAYDNFESYTDLPRSAAGLDGGQGWTTAWTGHQNVRVGEHSLSAAGVDGDGQSMLLSNVGSVDRAAYRQFDTQDDTVYASFLLRLDAGFDGADFVNVHVTDHVDNMGNTNHMLGAGILNNTGNPFFARVGHHENGDTDIADIHAGAQPRETFFVVAKFSKDAGSATYNRVDLFVFGEDDEVSSAEPGTTAATAISSVPNISTLQYLAIRTHQVGPSDEMLLDELRIGTSWAAAIPEPGTLALLSLGAVAGLRRRR